MDAAGRPPNEQVPDGGSSPPSGRPGQTKSVLVAVGVVLGLAVLLAALVDGCDDDGPGDGPGDLGDRSTPVAVARFDGPFARVVVDGAPGRVTIVANGNGSDHVAVADGGPPVTGHSDGGVLTLRWDCAKPGDCPGDTRVELPAALALELVQRSGSVDLVGLAGDVSVVAANAALTADGLRSESFDVALTSGSLDAGFVTAPDHVEVDLNSARATVRLPVGDGVRYRVTSAVTAGNLDVSVPESDDAERSIDVRITSGSAELLPE